MKPTQGKCKDCKHSVKEKHLSESDYTCKKLDSLVKDWWTGCVMWEGKNGKLL